MLKMRSGKKAILTILGITLFVWILYTYIFPVVTQVNSDMKAYETRIAIRDDYTLHTTPLPESVVDKICSNLSIKETSENCQPNVVVYAPELFDEIKTYFGNLPRQEKTYDVVQEKLSTYLDYCEKPNPDGSYRCIYDLRGDHVYPIFFFFNKNGMCYRIIANVGGS